MIEAVLFDLDDTLLGNDMEKFLPQYFALLGRYAERYLDRQRFLQELLFCTQVMVASTDRSISNRDIFWAAFRERTGLDPSELEPFFEEFYRSHFPQLQAVTQVRPFVADLVRTCLDRGLKVVVATNPLFPRIAIEHRLAWAGLPVSDYSFALVTSYENMHAAKPHQAYYREILDTIACSPEAALMVGDDWRNDIVPTAALGMFTYWVTAEEEVASPEEDLVTAYGTLERFYDLFISGWPGQSHTSKTAAVE